MREIKFRRAYFTDEECTKFSHFSAWGVNVGDSLFINPSTNNFAEHFIDCQYTGLNDNNGVDIYEGDITEIDGGGPHFYAEVFFEHGQFAARLPWITDPNETQPSLRAYVGWRFCSLEVVGNIYEHPQLLEQAKVVTPD